LTNCVMAITRQLAFMAQANNQVEPLNVQIKKEHVKPEIVDISLNTSDEGEHSDSERLRTSTVKIEHVKKTRTSVDNATDDVDKYRSSLANASSGDDSSESPKTETQPRRKKLPGKRVHSARYTQSKQRRDLTARNWRFGVSQNCTPARIETDIAEATVPSLGMVPDTLSRMGFAIIRNFKKVSRDDVNALYDSDSEENASSSVPREKSVFNEGNAPSAEQAAFMTHQVGLLLETAISHKAYRYLKGSPSLPIVTPLDQAN
jgi:hypothetical protein